MAAREQLNKLLEERKLLQQELAALDENIRAQEQAIAAESPAGWAAIRDCDGGYHTTPVPQGVFAALPGDRRATVLADGRCEVSWLLPFEGVATNRTLSPCEESFGVGADGGRFGFYPTRGEAEAAIARWQAEAEAEAD